MELIVGSDESELAVPGREFDVPGRAAAGRMAWVSASARSSNKRGVIMDLYNLLEAADYNTPSWFEYRMVVSAAAPARRSEKVGLLARVG